MPKQVHKVLLTSLPDPCTLIMPFSSWATAAVSILSIVPKFTVARRDPVSEVSSVTFFVKSGWFPLELTLALRNRLPGSPHGCDPAESFPDVSVPAAPALPLSAFRVAVADL